MKYKIKRIKSREITNRILMLVSSAIIFFLGFALTEITTDSILPEWIFQTH